MFLTWTVITLGFLISLGIVGWIFIYFTQLSLHNEDATRIDPLPNQHKPE